MADENQENIIMQSKEAVVIITDKSNSKSESAGRSVTVFYRNGKFSFEQSGTTHLSPDGTNSGLPDRSFKVDAKNQVTQSSFRSFGMNVHYRNNAKVSDMVVYREDGSYVANFDKDGKATHIRQWKESDPQNKPSIYLDREKNPEIFAQAEKLRTQAISEAASCKQEEENRLKEIDKELHEKVVPKSVAVPIMVNANNLSKELVRSA